MPSDLSNDWQTFGKDGIFWTRFVHLGHDAWSNAWIITIYHLPFRGSNVMVVDGECRDIPARIAIANGRPAGGRNGCIQSTI
jgi:hypothetical protein